VRSEIKRVVVCTHGDPSVAEQALRDALALLAERAVEVLAPGVEWEKHREALARAGAQVLPADGEGMERVGLCLVLGGDGTMLRGFQLTRDYRVPVAGINLGRVGFLTTVPNADLEGGLSRLLDGDFVEYPILGLEAELGSQVFKATNDVAINKGDRSRPCSLALKINGVTLFEVLCDGVVVGTPAGSSAYSLAAGGPLLGISVEAYVISLVAAHAVGVRPVVAAPLDILEIINTHEDADCQIDADGQRVAVLAPGSALQVRTTPALTSLALLEGDSLYHHFRDRLL
jgi:NAD+ kinase